MALKGATSKAHFSSARAHHVERSCAFLTWAWTTNAKTRERGSPTSPCWDGPAYASSAAASRRFQRASWTDAASQ
eukprot:2457110-Pyramimonas_sp.AAC.1